MQLKEIARNQDKDVSLFIFHNFHIFVLHFIFLCNNIICFIQGCQQDLWAYYN